MTRYRKVLITGAGGQLGQALQASAPEHAEIAACSREQFDLTDRLRVEETISTFRPEVIINAAAYTAVDRAEEEPKQAFAVNGEGPGLLAAAAAEYGSVLVHVSTDFVFDGSKGSPYRPDDSPSPLGVYGRSKLAGEAAVQRLIPGRHLIVRTSWLYAASGRNFVATMLRLLQARDELSVVVDQVGTPTWAAGLARALWVMLEKEFRGVYHWSDAGVASWYDFAVSIQEEALSLGLLEREKPIRPIPSSEFPTPAERPASSVLDKTSTWQELGYTAPHWRKSLRQMLLEMQGSSSL
jgi:dTDP-4-dehydrorhamnose reductase